MPLVLVVDDDEMVRQLVQLTLTQLGYDVVLAENGEVALKLFRENPPDLVLTDIVMPKKDGLELIEEIRHERPGQRILAMSGAGAAGLTEARALGADAAFVKPFSIMELAELLKQQLPPAAPGR